jgi:hypothetical protein
MIKSKALLFGLNYSYSSSKLNGCINDTTYMADYIQTNFNIPCIIYNDDKDLINTSYTGILSNLYKLAIDSYKDNLDFVWIHYSGHGSHQKDNSGDEKDGEDEGLVPSDFEKKGILIDDYIHDVLNSFNPKTKILFICDSCHSGTIADLKYSWENNNSAIIENINSKIKSQVISISGCLDSQTSADAYNLLGDNKSIGALTSCLLKTLKENPNCIYNVFEMVDNIRIKLEENGFKQYPKLSSSFNLSIDKSIFPSNIEIITEPNIYNDPSKININDYDTISNSDNQQSINQPQQPIYQPQQSINQPQQPIYQPQQPIYQPQQPIYQPQQPIYQPQLPIYQPQLPIYQPQLPIYQPQQYLNNYIYKYQNYNNKERAMEVNNSVYNPQQQRVIYLTYLFPL